MLDLQEHGIQYRCIEYTKLLVAQIYCWTHVLLKLFLFSEEMFL